MELRKITSENILDIVQLDVFERQKTFVEENIHSIAMAFATRESGKNAIPYGIYVNNNPIGFVLLGYGETGEKTSPKCAKDNYCIWEFMIDKRYQGKGFGKEALTEILRYIRSFPCGKAKYCWLSYVPENHIAKSLYEKFGFYENGETWDGETVAILDL